jgi:hypothetical protein
MSWPAAVPAIRHGTVPPPMVVTGTTMTYRADESSSSSVDISQHPPERASGDVRRARPGVQGRCGAEAMP